MECIRYKYTVAKKRNFVFEQILIPDELSWVNFEEELCTCNLCVMVFISLSQNVLLG